METKDKDKLNKEQFIKRIFLERADYHFRIPLAIGLILLAIVSALLVVQLDSFANQIALFAFLFLAAGIGWQFALALRRNQERQWLTEF